MRQRHRKETMATRSSSSNLIEDKFVQPDKDLLALSDLINKKTNTGRVNFYGVQQQDDIVEWHIVFQNGPKRATVALQGRPSEDQVDEFVTALEAWAGYKGEGSLYTTDVPKDPATEWMS